MQQEPQWDNVHTAGGRDVAKHNPLPKERDLGTMLIPTTNKAKEATR